MRFLLAILLLAPWQVWAACSGSSPTWTAAANSVTEIDLCIVAASAGDTINVPSGSASWVGLDTVSGLVISGAGSDAGGTVVTGGGITLNKHATDVTRLTGVRFTAQSATQVTIGGTYTDKAVIVDNTYHDFQSTNGLFDINSPGVLIHSSEFVGNLQGAPPDKNPLNFGDNEPATTIWGLDPKIGELDTNGAQNVYFEDNTFTNLMEVAWDCDNGAAVIFRYNQFTDSGVVMHAGKSDDGQDSSKWGCRLAEFYKNTFTRVSNTIPMNHWAHWRGHSGSFVLNALDNADSPDGFSYPNKAEVRFWIGCDGPDTTYPIAYQVGQIYPTVSDPPIRPLIITGNTGYGVQNIGLGEGVVKTCSSPSTFVQVDRDYVWDITTGVRASRPSTCTAPSTGNSGDYYWSTDGGGNWDTSNGAGADGAADKCTATDTWTDDFYVPYQYPHELRAGGESPETATSRLPGQAKGTMWTHFSLFVILTLSLLGAIHYGRNRRTHSTA